MDDTIKVGDMFSMETLEKLMDGFSALKEGGQEASFAFLNTLLEDGGSDMERFEISRLQNILVTYPLSLRSFMTANLFFNDATKHHALSEYRMHMELQDSFNNWVFYFTKTARLGGFAENEADDYTVLLKELKLLCRRCFPYLQMVHPAVRKRLRLLVGEIRSLDKSGNLIYCDFHSDPDPLLFESLSKERIEQLTNISTRLLSDRYRFFWVKNERELYEILHFHACAMNGHVLGFQNVTKEGAKALLEKTIIDDVKIKLSPYIVASLFEALCFHADNPIRVMVFALSNKEVLLRPYRYPIFCLSTEETWCRFLDSPTRLAHGIYLFLKKGTDVLEAFLSEEHLKDARQLVDNKMFVDDLCKLLSDPDDLFKVAGIYAAYHSRYADTFRLRARRLADEDHVIYRKQQTDVSGLGHWLSEERFITYELLDFGKYYDDRNVILKVVNLPEFAEWQPLFRLGYCNDPLVAAAVVERFPEAFQELPKRIANLINQEEQEKENDE